MSNYDFIKAGSKVFWHDPDGGLSDGVYQVVDVPEEIEEDSIILIASDYSEAEVFAAELSPAIGFIRCKGRQSRLIRRLEVHFLQNSSFP